jgi:hypothetical protein
MRAMDAALSDSGFATASARLDSSTYGGMSWLAHATLLTGIRTSDQLQYDLLGVERPRTLATIAHEAGYRTVLVAPNTHRLSPGSDFYDFDTTLDHRSFDYAGPAFAWASMPDQYVLDFVRRRIIDAKTSPLFLTYVLVSSHAPWSHIPTMVSDWSRIGNGFIYESHPRRRANTNWPDFGNAKEPYLTSILYDGALVIVLGDHQPVTEITANSSSWSVPIHVLSRDRALVAPFLARGYTPGMIPGQTHLPMEDFLPELVRDFSQGAS